MDPNFETRPTGDTPQETPEWQPAPTEAWTAPAAGTSSADVPATGGEGASVAPVAPAAAAGWTPNEASRPAWYGEPAPVLDAGGSARSSRPGTRLRTASGFFIVALLAATLASGGTYAVLQASGAFDHGSAAVAVASPTAQPASNATNTSLTPTPTLAPATSSAAADGSVVSVAAAVRPAVVTIISSASSTSGGQGDNPFGVPQPSSGSGSSPFQLPNGQSPTGVGSGIIFDSNGWILTNHHVVADASTLTVELSDGRTFPAKVYGVDTLTDLAIVKIDATGLPVARLGVSADVKVGQSVIAIGDPLGTYPGSVTTGVVSGLARTIDVSGGTLDDLIQTDASINPGNSGGPLLDMSGNVIGINTAEAGSAQGIGFAIPVDLARPLAEQALAGKPLSRPWLGIRYQPLDAGLAKTNHLSVTQGAWITAGQGSGQPAVEASGPAAAAGLKENDVIVAVDGTAVTSEHPLLEVLAGYDSGSTVTLTIARGTSTLRVQVTLGTRPASVQQ